MTDKKIILKSNIADGVNHREAARIAAKRADTPKEKEEKEAEFDYWSEKIKVLREELQSL